MERNREARKVPMAAAGNGFSRQRQRAGSFTEEEVQVEFPEAARLRDRGGSTKKDRDRERDRDIERDMERDRLNIRSKRRRGERLVMMQGNMDDDDSSEESINDDEEYDDGGGGGVVPPSSVKMLPPASNIYTASFSSASINHQRKSFPPTKVFRTSPSPASTPPPESPIISSLKAADEMIGVSVPRKSRSASTKRSHESWASSFNGGGVFDRQIATSPARASQASPSPPSFLVRKKMTPGPPRSPVEAAQEEIEIEIEIAEVLYGMMRQPQGPSKQKADEICNHHLSAKPTVEEKSGLSSPTSIPLTANSSSSNPSAIAPKRKKPRQVKYEEENFNTISTNEVPFTNQGEISRSAGENLSVLEATNPQQSTAGKESKPSLAPEKKKENDQESLPPKIEFFPGIKSDGDVTISLRVKALPTWEKKEKIDVNQMTPPEARSSVARDSDIGCVATEAKPKVTIVESLLEIKEDEKKIENSVFKEDPIIEPKVGNLRSIAEAKSENNCKLKLDLEKSDIDNISTLNSNKHQIQKHPREQLSCPNKAAQANLLPLHMSIPGWARALPTMGPTQGVMPTDASSLLPSTTLQPPHLFFNQPRPKRCATHCYIARNIHYHQQFSKINPFWPAAAASVPLYGSKACNLSLMPSAELQGSVFSRCSNSVPDKSSQSTLNSSDTAQRKQVFLHQALPPGAGNNILHPPAYIFPLGQQPHAAAAIAAASVRPPNTGNKVVSSGATTASVSIDGSASTAPAGATTMSFSYPNMPSNETQYMAILQNNGYPFPVPAHVGAPPAGYRGVTGQPIPFFNGSFYSSQMVHAPHLQPQQQSGQGQQSHALSNQNANVSTGPSAAQKHTQNQQHRPPVNSQGYPNQKVQSQPLSYQQRQQPRENPTQHCETAGEDSPSTADNRASRSNVAYSQHSAMPMQSTNMGLMGSATPSGGVVRSSNNPGEKKPEHQGSKAGAESIQSPQSYAMTFATFNGGLNMPSIAHNHAIFHGVPETSRQGYHQMMAASVAAQAAKQKINYSGPEDVKSGSSAAANSTEERKPTGANGKTTTACVGQSIAFSSKQDAVNASVSAVTNGNIIDTSARLPNLGSAQPWSSSSAQTSHQQQHMQQNQPQQQYSSYLQMQQQYAVAAARGKGPVTSNRSVFLDHNVSPVPSAGANVPNATSGFHQNLVQAGSGSPAQSLQRNNNSSKANTMAQAQSSSMLLPSASSSLKNGQQKQQGRPQQSLISFGANAKTLPSNSPSPSTSSVSKNAEGSSITTAPTSMPNKSGHGKASSSTHSSSQPPKNTHSASTAGGKNNGSDILGNPNVITATSNPTSKSQQQPQLFFSSSYMQPQYHQQQQMNISPASGYYIQRHQQQQVGSSAAATSVTLPSCNTATSDPAKAINMKGGGNNNLQHTQTSGQFVPPGFPYVHAVQVKPGEQKKQAGE